MRELFCTVCGIPFIGHRVVYCCKECRKGRMKIQHKEPTAEPKKIQPVNHKQCDNCEYQVKIQSECFTALYFGDRFKFCPNCGNPVVRFANLPKFVEEFNYAIFNDIDSLYKQFQDNLDYYCRVTLTKEEFEEMKSKCQFAVELYENGGACVSPAVSMVAKMSSKNWHYTAIQKLIKRVEEGAE